MWHEVSWLLWWHCSAWCGKNILVKDYWLGTIFEKTIESRDGFTWIASKAYWLCLAKTKLIRGSYLYLAKQLQVQTWRELLKDKAKYGWNYSKIRLYIYMMKIEDIIVKNQTWMNRRSNLATRRLWRPNLGNLKIKFSNQKIFQAVKDYLWYVKTHYGGVRPLRGYCWQDCDKFC